MAVTITGAIMSNDQTAHTTGLADPGSRNAGQVTSGPGRLTDRSGALRAMTLAGSRLGSDHYLRQDISDGAELGRTGLDAAVRASASPSESGRQPETDREAGA